MSSLETVLAAAAKGIGYCGIHSHKQGWLWISGDLKQVLGLLLCRGWSVKYLHNTSNNHTEFLMCMDIYMDILHIWIYNCIYARLDSEDAEVSHSVLSLQELRVPQVGP